MIWDYRIVRFKGQATDSGFYYEVQEVYYNADGKLDFYAPAEVGGDTEDEVRACYEMLREAFGKPVVNEEDFPGSNGEIGQRIIESAE